MEGRVKQLLPWRGKTLIEHALDCVAQSQVDEKVLVLGAHWEEIRAVIENTPAVRRGKSWRALLNRQWEEGHAASIRVGLGALLPHTDAAIFVNADQPFLTPQVIDALIQRYRETDAPIVRAVYAGKPGSPALFNRAFFGELAALEGDEGGRAIIARNADKVARVEFDDARLGWDVDTVEDYEKVTGGM
jgi:molybdenum cofactor cytidylyltransferase